MKTSFAIPAENRGTWHKIQFHVKEFLFGRHV
jgi:hypothetical protein